MKIDLKNFFRDPKSTTSGIGALGAAALMGYGMYTGTTPINQESIAITIGLISAGVAGVVSKDSSSYKTDAITIINHYTNLKDKTAKLNEELAEVNKIINENKGI